RLDLVDLLVAVRLQFDRVVLLALARLRAFGPYHQPVLAREHRAVLIAEHLRGPLVHSSFGEFTRLVERSDERVSAIGTREPVQRSPPCARARRVERVDAAQRITFHQLAMLFCDTRDFVLTDQRVTADQRRWRDRLLPTGLRAVTRIAPQRVVVAIRNCDVAE